MTHSERAADLIDDIVAGEPWHGPSAGSLLEGLSAREAASRPVRGGHSIWEIVLHLTGWTDEVRLRLEGAEAGAPPEGDWPKVARATPAEWSRAVARLIDSHAALSACVRGLRDSQLDRPVVDFRGDTAGKGASRYGTLHGAAHHTVYHTGQIALLASALKRRARVTPRKPRTKRPVARRSRRQIPGA